MTDSTGERWDAVDLDAAGSSREETKEVTSSAFLDERPTSEGSGRPMGGPPNAAPQPDVMPEAPFSARDLLKKPVLIRNVQWTTSMERGDSILPAGQEIDVPNILNSAPNVQLQALQLFAFFRAALFLRIQVNTSAFHQGRLIASVDPFHQMADVTKQTAFQKNFNTVAATMLPSAQVDASRSNVVNLHIPWEHILDSLTTNSKDAFDIMARVRINVLNKLQVVTGSTTSANVLVFLYAKDVTVNVPIYPHEAQIPTLRYVMQVMRMKAAALDEVVSGAKTIASSVASGVQHFVSGDISGAVTDFKNLAGGVNEALGGMNFDKPAMTAVGYVNHMSPVAPLAHMRGGDTSARLSVSPLGNYVNRNRFSGTTPMEMNIQRVLARKGLTEQLSWTKDQVPGTILRRIPVLPSFCRWTAAGAANGRLNCNLNTYLSYISSYFTFWRGSIEYEFDFVSTTMQAGRLAFAFVPNAIDRSHQPSLDEMSNNPIAYFDLHGGTKRVNITVPFQSAVPRKIYVPWANVNEDNFTDNHISGYLYVIVANQLANPASVVDNVEINVYIGAGPDYELDVPRQRPENLFRNQIFPPGNMKACACDEDVPTTEGAVVAPPAPPVSVEEKPPEKSVCGMDNDLQARESVPIPRNVLSAGARMVKRLDAFRESGLDVKDLSRRYSMYRKLCIAFPEQPFGDNKGGANILAYENSGSGRVRATGAVRNKTLRLPVTPVLETLYSTNDLGDLYWVNGVLTIDPVSDVLQPGSSSTNLFVCAMARMYAVWSGGLRFKVVPYSDRTTAVAWNATYVMDDKEIVSEEIGNGFVNTTIGGHSAYPTLAGNFSQNAAIEVETPFYSVYNQLVTSTFSLADPNALSNGELQLTFATVPNQTRLPVFSAATGVIEMVDDVPTIVEYPAGTPYMMVDVYVAAGDDMAFGYLVSPPETYTQEQIVPPPTNSLNSAQNQKKMELYRKQVLAMCDHMTRIYPESEL